jgi:hypothetical protein
MDYCGGIEEEREEEEIVTMTCDHDYGHFCKERDISLGVPQSESLSIVIVKNNINKTN